MQKHGFPDELLLLYFYQSIDIVNKVLVDHLVRGGIVKQPFVEASRLLDEMTKNTQAWYTSEDYVSLPHSGIFREQ